jgi:predicted nuclease of predicted toxin-antitoxin system
VKFLIDKNASFRICSVLEAAGHEAVHVDSLNMATAEDVDILERARSDESVVISSDADFGALLAAQRATSPSVILTRTVSRLSGPDLARLILANLDAFVDALQEGVIVAIGTHGIRLRRLPLR